MIAPNQARLEHVDLSKVWWDKRFRDDMGDITALAESIKDKGVLQPITVTPDLELLAGCRRVTAARAAELTTIPALIRNKEDAIDAREVELLENAMRKDFTWDEQADLVREIDRMCKEKHVEWSGRKTAQLLNAGVTSVARSIQLARAMEAIPELRQEKTADDAFKILKKLEEQTIVEELAKRQKHAVETGGLQKGIAEMLKVASSNYRVGDVFKGLAELRTGGRIDLIECDPPYGINLNEQKQSKETSTSNVHTYHEVSEEAYPKFLENLTKELFRVAAPNCWLVFWFGPTWQHPVLTSLRVAGWNVDEIPAIWSKGQGQTNQPELYLARTYEPFYLCRKGQPLLMKRGRSNVFEFSTTAGQKKIHPTERPIPLIQEVLDTLGTVRQNLLVPFLGSGVTLRAAYNLGMSAFGWDLNGEYKSRFLLAVEEDAHQLNGDDRDDNEE